MQESSYLGAAAADHNRGYSHECHQPTKSYGRKLELADIGIGLDLGGEEHVDRHEGGEGADVENALHGPNPYLGRDRHSLFLGDQVGADELARTSQQRQAGETDKGGGNQILPAGTAHWLQKNLPAHRPQHIGGINQKHGDGDLQQVDVAGGPKTGPVERAPVLYLEIDQRAQDDYNNGSGEDALLGHVGAGPRGKAPN